MNIFKGTGKNHFTRGELLLWGGSSALIVLSCLIFNRSDPLTPVASLTGVTSLIFNAKGRPAGQLLMIIFSVLYGIISFSSAYYGEMITYLGMTAPMAAAALISWIRNPWKGGGEVRVNRLRGREALLICVLTAAVTAGFYFILAAFNTAKLPVSTLSVATSFIAAWLTFRRSAYFALAYAANDLVLIVLWLAASLHDLSCISVVICFSAFLANDIYGFISWTAMEKRQAREEG